MTDSSSSGPSYEVIEAILLAFGRKIREERERMGYSQESFAFKSGFHRTYIGAVERGEQNFTIETLMKIASALEVDLCSLFTDACRTVQKAHKP